MPPPALPCPIAPFRPPPPSPQVVSASITTDPRGTVHDTLALRRCAAPAAAPAPSPGAPFNYQPPLTAAWVQNMLHETLFQACTTVMQPPAFSPCPLPPGLPGVPLALPCPGPALLLPQPQPRHAACPSEQVLALGQSGGPATWEARTSPLPGTGALSHPGAAAPPPQLLTPALPPAPAPSPAAYPPGVLGCAPSGTRAAVKEPGPGNSRCGVGPPPLGPMDGLLFHPGASAELLSLLQHRHPPATPGAGAGQGGGPTVGLGGVLLDTTPHAPAGHVGKRPRQAGSGDGV